MALFILIFSYLTCTLLVLSSIIIREKALKELDKAIALKRMLIETKRGGLLLRKRKR